MRLSSGTSSSVSAFLGLLTWALLQEGPIGSSGFRPATTTGNRLSQRESGESEQRIRARTANAAFLGSRNTALFQSLYPSFDYDDDDDDEDDDLIDADALGDWRTFRRNLATSASAGAGPDVGDLWEEEATLSLPATTAVTAEQQRQQKANRSVVSRENEELLKTQNEVLAEEYVNDVWAHTIATVRL